MKRLIILAVVASGLALAGCQSFPTPAPTTGSRAAPSSASTAGAMAGSTAGGQALSANGMNRTPSSGPGSSPESRTVYFAFNKSVVQSQYFPLLKNQAAYLTAHPNIRVLLAGYTDDRGTWEYNIGLGSRRAAAVRQFLLLQGVDASQIQTISYGEAYPEDPQNNEVAWTKNRRVVIKFQAGR
jgi:peptidoglycan-associated lipoprotein